MVGHTTCEPRWWDTVSTHHCLAGTAHGADAIEIESNMC